MQLKSENYRGYTVKFAEKVMGGRKLVVGEFPSKVTGRVLGTNGSTKSMVFNGVKKMIDREFKVKGLK